MHRSDHTQLLQTALPDAAAEAVAVCYFLLVAASCAAVVAGVFVTRRRPARVRADPPHGSFNDAYEAAFLAGGPGRAADAALAALHEDGRLTVAHPGVVGVAPGAAARHPVEAAVLATYAAAPSGALHWLRAAVMRAPAVQALGDGLAARGLMVPPGPLLPWRRRITAHLVLCVAGVPLGLVLAATSSTARADSAYSDVQLALVVLLGGGVGVLCSRVARDRATARGRFALRLHRVRTRKAAGGAAHAVAVRGLRGVADAELRKQLAQARRLRVGHQPTVPVAASGARPGDAAVWTGAPVGWCAGGTGCGGSSCGTANRDGEGDGRSGSGCGSGGSGCGGGG
ncbi:TIGR04222 domain-containing membrane protein, partial [Streptomyces sp. NRRL B-1347]|uniref:TIGR04222 domain-containing membrane protein n=1 Tax=Streptomyces sp. NRRL B-1347 TaxID=1476877 RepID=UPI00068D1D17